MFGLHTRRRLALLTSVLALLLAGLELTAPSARAERPTTYVVAPGDTLWSIAVARSEGDPRAAVAAIRRQNALAGVTVHVGQRLLVPSGA